MGQAEKRALLLEDDEFCREIATQHLGMLGYGVVAVPTIAEAVLHLLGGAFDLWVFDVFIRGSKIDGVDLLAVLRETDDVHQAACVVASAVYLGDGDVRRDVENGLHGIFLPKPFQKVDLAGAINRAKRRMADVEGPIVDASSTMSTMSRIPAQVFTHN